MSNRKLKPVLENYQRMAELLSETTTIACDLASHIRRICQPWKDDHVIDISIDVLKAFSKVHQNFGASAMSCPDLRLQDNSEEASLLRVIGALQRMKRAPTEMSMTLVKDHTRAGDLITELLIGIIKLSRIIKVRFTANHKLMKSVGRAYDVLKRLQMSLSLSAENHFDDVHGGDMYFRDDYIRKVIENSDKIDVREDVSKWPNKPQVYDAFTRADICVLALDQLVKNGTIRSTQAANGERFSPKDINDFINTRKSSS